MALPNTDKVVAAVKELVMAEQVIMPKLGFDMAEGTLISWTKQVGDDQKRRRDRGDRDR